MAADKSHRTIARLVAYLDDMYFPCSRRDILERAENNEAPDVLLDAIEGLPDRGYWSIRDILSWIRDVTAPPRLPRESAGSAVLSGPAPEPVAGIRAQG
jgi:hypothetical protein